MLTDASRYDGARSLPTNWSDNMRLPRFSIANILALIAILAVALAALRTPSYLWANVTYSIALGALVVAIVNLVYGREARRAYWLGFSLCGGIYLTVYSVPMLRDSVGSRLVTETILDFIYPHLAPATSQGSNVTVVWTGPQYPQWLPDTYSPTGSTYVTLPQATLPQAPPLTPSQPPAQSRWAEWTQPDRVISSRLKFATFPLCNSEAFRQIGHSMFTLLVAILGATFARHRYRASTRDRPASPSAS